MKSLVIPKRKVPARVRLSDSTVYDGSLYTAVRTSKGVPERVVDRLNNPSERYLPFALEAKHVLLNKAGVVTVRLQNGEGEIDQSAPSGVKELRLRVNLSNGKSLQGKTYAALPLERSRMLDYLNHMAPRFITLQVDGQVMVVNRDYVTAVTEVFE